LIGRRITTYRGVSVTWIKPPIYYLRVMMSVKSPRRAPPLATFLGAVFLSSACSPHAPNEAPLPGTRPQPDAAQQAGAPPPSAGSAASPASIKPIDPASWFDASRSKAKRIALTAPHCIDDSGGCPFAATALPACPAGQAFLDLTVETLNAIDGMTTVLRATLWDAGMIPAYHCTPRCCHGNDPPRPFILVPVGTSLKDRFRSPRIPLVDAQNPYAFACQADESRTCCDIEPETNVLIYGTFRLREQRIENPRLCRTTP
jgi:hypothetical protein